MIAEIWSQVKRWVSVFSRPGQRRLGTKSFHQGNLNKLTYGNHGTNLRKSWMKACAAAGLGKLLGVDEHDNQRYSGLIVHNLRRSAIRNLVTAGVPEKVAMATSGHKTRAVFDRYQIIAEEDVPAAMRRVQGKPVSVQGGAQSERAAQKLLKSL